MRSTYEKPLPASQAVNAIEMAVEKAVSDCYATCVVEIIPSDCSRDDAAECTREHCSGYVDSEALRLFFLLVP